ncbi:hypothetical protein GGTG_11944 [Gaeumannomyces tritici R3-111a-1]|uniref:Uncharacterized protein n=1 Tax=Gaeumannomyces tritici (strain R3-111a-1) TaxID=644352 RepID=J3PEL3_GAET3|nr:hypothetical protein GGTG_11944 [Gaeumannomyces tritici R3-111a-1]EJT70921.1 hypothetical protein GGTG_11944 [Gaeumannomyces tritici R3-111a-1]
MAECGTHYRTPVVADECLRTVEGHPGSGRLENMPPVIKTDPPAPRPVRERGMIGGVLCGLPLVVSIVRMQPPFGPHLPGPYLLPGMLLLERNTPFLSVLLLGPAQPTQHL